MSEERGEKWCWSHSSESLLFCPSPAEILDLQYSPRESQEAIAAFSFMTIPEMSIWQLGNGNQGLRKLDSLTPYHPSFRDGQLFTLCLMWSWSCLNSTGEFPLEWTPHVLVFLIALIDLDLRPWPGT